MRYALFSTGLFLVWSASALAQRVIEIDLTNQRVYLLDRDRVVLNAPISSGRPGHETPTGTFHVTEKDVNHASSFYGFFGNPATRQIVVPDADIAMKVPRGLEFVRAPMRYYLQFQPAIGLHAGFLPGYPASHGCVRIPEQAAITLFQSVSVGTPVRVYGHPQLSRPYWASERTAAPAAGLSTPLIAPAFNRVHVPAFGWRGDRDRESFHRDRDARDAAFDRFDAEWDAKEKYMEREIDALEHRIDHAAGPRKAELELALQGFKRARDELDIRRDAAKDQLKREWGDD
jgi:L,D-transpeptidase catalytic domain